MANKKRIFETKEIRNIRLMEWGVIGIFSGVVLYFIVKWRLLEVVLVTLSTIWYFLMNEGSIDSIFTAILLLLMTVAGLGIFIYFFYGILVASILITTRKQREVKEWHSTYESNLDIDYFRETLTNLDGVTASILMNKEIEVPKDLVAQTVQLFRLGFVNFENQKMYVVKKNQGNLSHSNRCLLTLIETQDFSQQAVDEWRFHAMKDAVEGRYIVEEVKIKGPNYYGCCFKYVAAIIILIFSVKLVENLDPDNVFQFLDGAEDTAQSY